MMSRTHLSMGIATALVLAEPGSVPMCLAAIVGGGLGGVTPDIDTINGDYKSDSMVAQVLAIGIVALIFVIDRCFGLGISSAIFNNRKSAMPGAALYIGLLIVGFFTAHRSFTHSLLAMVLFSYAVNRVYTPLSVFYAAGYLSHLVLDVLNKRGIRLFFPLSFRVSLNLFYADRAVNRLLTKVGVKLSAILFVFKILW